MVLRKSLLLLALVVITLSAGCATEGYRIEVKVDGISNTESFLGYHFGDRQYLKDTVQVDSQGRFVFEGHTPLDPGMYLVVVPEQRYFEIIVDNNQHFSVSANVDDFVSSMQFEGSPDNQAFYNYLRYIQENGEKMRALNAEAEDESTSESRRAEISSQMEQTDQSVQDLQQQYISDFPDGLFTKVLLAQREPELPDPPQREDGTPDHTAMYQIFKSRFWENIDFSDDRLLRTPVYHSKLAQYFNRVLMQIPDTIISEAGRIIDKTRGNDEMFKYTVWFITNNFERSQIMGMDAVFVHMVEEYYMSGEAFWVEPANLERISERAMRLKPLLIGQVAPEVTMFSPEGKQVALHDIEAEYLVVYFWDSECSHCKVVTPALGKLSESMKNNGLKVYGVNIEADRDKWLNAVDRYEVGNWINVNDPQNRSGFRDKYDIYATPLIFLLDGQKRIMAKRISVEQVEDIILRETLP